MNDREHIFVKQSRRVLIPLLLTATAVGVVNDFFLPASSLGIWVGFCFIALATMLLMVKKDSRLGLFFNRLAIHWKTPLVASLVLTGIVMSMLSVVTTKHKGNGGYLSAHFQQLNEIQTQLNFVQQQLDEASNTSTSVKSNAASVLAKALEAQIASEVQVREQLYTQGLDITDGVSALSDAAITKQTEEFVSVLRQFKEASYGTTGIFRPWPDSKAAFRGDLSILALPRELPFSHIFIVDVDNIANFKAYINKFPEELHRVSSVTRGYAINELSNGRYCLNFSSIMPQHPLGLCNEFRAGPNRFSLVSFRELSRNESLSVQRGGYSLLHTAATLGRVEYINFLFESGVNLNGLSHAGYTPLSLALEQDHFEAAELLISLGSDISINDFIAIEVALMRSLSGLPGLAIAHPEQLRANNADPAMRQVIERSAILSENDHIILFEKMIKNSNLTESSKNVVLDYYQPIHQRLKDHLGTSELIHSINTENTEIAVERLDSLFRYLENY